MLYSPRKCFSRKCFLVTCFSPKKVERKRLHYSTLYNHSAEKLPQKVSFYNNASEASYVFNRLSSNVENSNATILVIFKHCEYIACNDKIISCRVKKEQRNTEARKKKDKGHKDCATLLTTSLPSSGNGLW